ncbi:MAG TPA: hypothetical protein VFB43_05750 [Terracidiphilus sp.]|jgi:hypothetical protein|nr:hypothetical protein [Terracidiphilus sp.]
MAIAEILASIDRQIAQLKQARALLDGDSPRPGRRAGTSKRAANAITKPGRRKKRALSPEGRKRIAEAQKKRWEAQRKASAQK